MPPPRGFKKRLTEGVRKPIFPSRETLIEEREREGQRAPLWEQPRQGRDITLSNVANDALGAMDDLTRNPQRFTSRLKTRLGRYVDHGPDINNPVPLTRNPFRTRRKS